MSPTEDKPGGVFSGVRRMMDAALGLVQTRLRLFSLELESEKLRLLDTLLKAAVAIGVLGIGGFIGALALALFAWQVASYAGLILLMGLFLAAGAFLLWRLRRELQQTPPPFERTLAEFDKDRACLTGKD
jgi:uncharacterized membrane protein YqjE